MKKILIGCVVLVCLSACGNKKMKMDPFEVLTAMVDSVREDSVTDVADTLSSLVHKGPQRVEADELFDDFIFNYALDTLFQQQRTVFPLPYYKVDIPLKIEKKDWEHDPLFARQTCYTLLFDKEEDMDLVGDTALSSVQVEWIFLDTRMVKRYYFQRIHGVWMLEAINLREMESEGKGEHQDFVTFYSSFASDSLFQGKHIHTPLQFVTLDPDDEFSILETTLDLNQWYAFRPSLPTDKLSNINYGQKNEDLSTTKILKVNGVSNGYSNIFYFRKRRGEWELYKYEDSSM